MGPFLLLLMHFVAVVCSHLIFGKVIVIFKVDKLSNCVDVACVIYCTLTAV